MILIEFLLAPMQHGSLQQAALFYVDLSLRERKMRLTERDIYIPHARKQCRFAIRCRS